MDAIYLLGCYFSRSGDTSSLEKVFLARTLCGIPDAMQHSDRVIDVLRASCLLAVYFFATARVLEGYYHSSIAARLSVSLGLHQIKPDHWYSPQLPGTAYSQAPSAAPKSSIQLAPPKDIAEFEERKAAFQQIFAVDRAWSVATGLPSAIPDDSDTQAQIDRVWATSLNPYSVSVFPTCSMMQLFKPVNVDTIQCNNHPKIRSCCALPYFQGSSCEAFREELSVGVQYVARTMVGVFIAHTGFYIASSNMKTDTYWMDHQRLELALVQFSSSLPRIGLFGGQNALTLSEVDLLTIHTMVHVSTIHLHRELSQANQDSYSKCLAAAGIVTSLIRELGDEYYDYLDPISSVSCVLNYHPVIVPLTPADYYSWSLDMLDLCCRRVCQSDSVRITYADAARHL